MAEKTQEEIQAEEAAKLATEREAVEKAKLATKGVSPNTEPANEPAKLQMTEDELQAKIAEATSKAIAEREAQLAKEAELKAAEEQGNYKKLYEEEEKKRKRAELAQFRSEAINKFKLSEKAFDYLNGETKDEIFAAAKQIRKMVDEAVEEAKKLEVESGLPHSDSTRRTAPRTSDDATKKTVEGLGSIFGKQLDLSKFARN